MIDPKEGKILFDGKPVESCLKDVFYYENVEWLDGNLKGEDYIAFVKKMWDSKVDKKPVIQALNMEEYIRIPIKKYSLGMKQKLIIGMYLISDAPYLIPYLQSFAHLFPTTYMNFSAIVNGWMSKQFYNGYLILTHGMYNLMIWCLGLSIWLSFYLLRTRIYRKDRR